MDIKEFKLGVTNNYLIKAGNRFLLVDTGYDNTWELFCQRLKEAGVSLSEISHLLLTHHHDDHSGLINKVVQENPAIQIVMSYRAKDYLSAGQNHHTQSGGWVNRRVKLLFSLVSLFNKRWRTHTFPAYQARVVDVLIKGETRLKDIGIGLNGKIIETPGHCQDSISLVFDDGDCVVGDAASNFPGFLGTNFCVIIIEDVNVYYQSWRKLISAGACRIFPAHGKPFPVEKLEQNMGRNR